MNFSKYSITTLGKRSITIINITPPKAKAKAYGTTVKVEIVSLLRSKVKFLDNRFILDLILKPGNIDEFYAVEYELVILKDFILSKLLYCNDSKI